MAATPTDRGVLAVPRPRSASRTTRGSLRTSGLRFRARLSRSAGFKVAVLTLVTVVVAQLVLVWPAVFASGLLLVPFLLGAWVLPMRWLILLATVVVASRVVVSALRDDEQQPAIYAAFVVLVVLVLLGVRTRTRLGVAGSRGESMLFDLRERLLAQGELPDLPPGWRADVVYRSAHGDSFGGDFLVSARSIDGRSVELCLIDVSGKGIDAGTRALLLSGAFGGLLGSVPAHGFLGAANSYLVRQRWDEGFATALHVALDLQTGSYQVGNAGHPPAVHFHAGSGEWEVISTRGPALGLLNGISYEHHQGELLPGDALLVYTDGLVETADRDLSIGIDRMLGAAERLVTGGFESGATTLMDAVPAGEGDDRACLLLWRV